MCHVDKFVRAWKKIPLVFFRVLLLFFFFLMTAGVAASETRWLSVWESNLREEKISACSGVRKIFLKSCWLWPVLPCCAQAAVLRGYGAFKYLRLFWFSLLQECTACVIHRQPKKWSMSSISRGSPQDYILWRQEKHKPASGLASHMLVLKRWNFQCCFKVKTCNKRRNERKTDKKEY